jgi:membrane protein YdbS with pleckstrin-like domain
MENSSIEDGGTVVRGSWPLGSILTIVFVVLKLTHTIDWSWIWVLSPLWISAAFTAFVLFLAAIVIAIIYATTKKNKKRVK